MEKLFYQTPYIKEFDAKVLSCTKGKKGFETVLSATGFYPEGGGQPADTGTLGNVRVTDVQEKDGTIIHYTDGELTPGETCHGVIDWEERFSNMQLHSGEHIVSGLIHRHYGYDNVGFHMGSEEMTIDLNGPLTWEQLLDIEREANGIVYADVPIHVSYPTAEELQKIDYRSKKELTGQVRIVEIPGADCCACCGTHVDRTGEIGPIKFLSMINYKGGVRITMLCGRKAQEDHILRTNQILALSNLLSAKTGQIVEAVERVMQESTEKDARFSSLQKELFQLKAEKYPVGNGLVLDFEEDYTPVQVRQFCNLLKEQGRGRAAAVFSGNDADGYSFCAASETIDMRAAGKELNRRLNGRGGGSPRMIQGTFHADRDAICAVFQRLLGEEE